MYLTRLFSTFNTHIDRSLRVPIAYSVTKQKYKKNIGAFFIHKELIGYAILSTCPHGQFTPTCYSGERDTPKILLRKLRSILVGGRGWSKFPRPEESCSDGHFTPTLPPKFLPKSFLRPFLLSYSGVSW